MSIIIRPVSRGYKKLALRVEFSLKTHSGYPKDAEVKLLCERCLLITESPKTPGHYRYIIWVLVYISYTGLAVFSLRFLVFLCILRF